MNKTLSNNVKIPKFKKTTLKSVTYSIFVLTALGILVLTVVTSLQVEKFLKEELRTRITDVVHIMAEKIDGDLHSQIQTVEDSQSAAFIKLKNDLVKMREHSTGISNIYTMRKMDDGTYIFVVDGSPKDQNQIGDVYPSESETEAFNRAFDATPENNTAYTEPEIYKDDWGIWLSAYAPIFTSSGKLDGIIGVDVSAESIYEHELKFTFIISIASLCVMICTFPFLLRFMNLIRAIVKEKEQANEWNKTVLNNLGDGVYTLDSNGNVTYLNTEAEKMLGWTLVEIKGKSICQFIHHQKTDSPLLFNFNNKGGFKS
jgi:PAS domain-containing protein